MKKGKPQIKFGYPGWGNRENPSPAPLVPLSPCSEHKADPDNGIGGGPVGEGS